MKRETNSNQTSMKTKSIFSKDPMWRSFGPFPLQMNINQGMTTFLFTPTDHRSYAFIAATSIADLFVNLNRSLAQDFTVSFSSSLWSARYRSIRVSPANYSNNWTCRIIRLLSSHQLCSSADFDESLRVLFSSPTDEYFIGGEGNYCQEICSFIFFSFSVGENCICARQYRCNFGPSLFLSLSLWGFALSRWFETSHVILIRRPEQPKHRRHLSASTGWSVRLAGDMSGDSLLFFKRLFDWSSSLPRGKHRYFLQNMIEWTSYWRTFDRRCERLFANREIVSIIRRIFLSTRFVYLR